VVVPPNLVQLPAVCNTASPWSGILALAQKVLSRLANCNSEMPHQPSVHHTGLGLQQRRGTARLSHDGRRNISLAEWNKHFPVWVETSDSALSSGERERVRQRQAICPSAKQTIALVFPLEKGLFSKGAGGQTASSVVAAG